MVNRGKKEIEAIAATVAAVLIAAVILLVVMHSGNSRPRIIPDSIVHGACAGIAHLSHTVDCNTAIQELARSGTINPADVRFIGTDLTMDGNTIIYKFRITLKNGERECYVVNAYTGRIMEPC